MALPYPFVLTVIFLMYPSLVANNLSPILPYVLMSSPAWYLWGRSSPKKAVTVLLASVGHRYVAPQEVLSPSHTPHLSNLLLPSHTLKQSNLVVPPHIFALVYP